MARILVTGATGFVGRSLCRALMNRGDDVVAVVRKTSPREVLPAHIEFFAVNAIGPETSWNRGLLKSVDIIVHLAAHVHRSETASEQSDQEFFRVNTQGTQRLLAASGGQVRRFVFVSSVHAMCRFSETPLTEDSPCQPDTPYGRSKLAAEDLVRQMSSNSPTETVILRPTPVYGAGQLGNLSRLFDYVQSGRMLPFGRVHSRRSLLYVENFVDAILAGIDHPAAAGETFLVSDGDEISLRDLTRKVRAALGGNNWLLPVPVGLMKLGGMLTGKSSEIDRLLGSLTVDISKIRERLHWHPPFTLERGLQTTTARMIPGKAA